MTLNDLVVPSLVHKYYKTYAPDDLWSCWDRWHYLQYPHKISYQFNSRGFRDQEWPDDLKNAVWCVGDSITVGIGSPLEHTWPKQLSKLSGYRTINLGLRGANNRAIAEMANTVLREVQPKNMIIVWSFLERRPKDANDLLQDFHSQRLIAPEHDHISYFEQCLNLLAHSNTNIVQAFIPNYFSIKQNTINGIWDRLRGPDWPEVPWYPSEIPDWVHKELDGFGVLKDVNTALYLNQVLRKIPCDLGEIIPQDLARDGCHFDIATAQALAQQILSQLDIN